MLLYILFYAYMIMAMLIIVIFCELLYFICLQLWTILSLMPATSYPKAIGGVW